MFRTVPLSIVGSYSLYTQQCYISYRFVDGFRAAAAAGSGWNCNSILILLLESCLQTCMTYIIAECTVINSRWWTEELSETCRVSFQNKFEKSVHLFGFVIRKFVMMHGHMKVKYSRNIVVCDWDCRSLVFISGNCINSIKLRFLPLCTVSSTATM
jgi:hypothetical protein